MKILVFDTETTGLPEKNASIYDKNNWPYIVQLSYVFYDLCSNNLITKDNYINIPENVDITEDSFKIHKLSREFLNNNGINIKDALIDFNNALANSDLVVGHNISFDKRMIFVECLRNNVDQNFTKCIFRYNKHTKITKPEFCTMKNTKEYCNIIKLTKTNKSYYKLPKLTELYIKLFPDSPIPNDLHNSMVDVLCTLRCYLKYAYNIDIIGINEKVYELFLQLN